jgi:hypothetical protein
LLASVDTQKMATDIDLPVPATTSAVRRFIASALAFSYGYILFILWFNPLVTLSTQTEGDSDRLMWISLGVSFVVMIVSILCIPRRYYNLRPFERGGRIYRRFGVRQFRYIVGEGEGIQRVARWIDPQWQSFLSKRSYEDREKWTRLVEAVHIGMIFLSLPFIGLAYYRGFTTLATVYLLSNIPFNIWPVLLLRYSRGKLLRISKLQSKRPPL